MKSTIKETKEMILDELNKAYENNPTKEKVEIFKSK